MSVHFGSTAATADVVISQPGLPDFSWYKIPKREKYTKLPQTVHKI
jgi:hypothetical protein